ncbi:MAG: Adaptive-response sensory-kinase SasA [Candidatus Scalindua arabica]|uniref:histidine kinase n=1 Tax=Candidatus Scalindua arabica TaxID=1127984 RepID=A0A941W0H6_9BACT|nr:Adaptive-response sensory-kinase SasA [Candidatus Scalindua arabica]
MSLKTKLLIFTLSISLIPISIITTLYYYNTRNTIKRQTLDWLTAVAESRKAHTISFLDGKKGRVVDFSSDGFIRDSLEIISHRGSLNHLVSDLNRHLKVNKKPLDSHIVAIAVVDMNGKVVSSTNEEIIGADVSKHDIYVKSIRNAYGETYVGNTYRYSFLDEDCIFVSAPITGKYGGKEIGIIINAYDLKSLSEITANRVGMGETGEVYIVNRDKKMITESRFIENAIFNQVVDTEPVRRIIEDDNSGMTSIYPGYRGMPVVGASIDIPEYGWILLAEVDKVEAFASIMRLRIYTIILGNISAIVVITITILLSKRVTRPIQRLVEGTRRIANGDFAYRIVTETKDEIGYLAASFNDMIFQLEVSEKQIEDYALNLEQKVEDKSSEVKKVKEYTENLIETAQDAIISIYEDGTINVWNKSAEKIFRYSKSDIIGQSVLTIIPEKYKKRHQAGLKRFLETQKPVIIGKTIEFTGLTREGSEIPIEMSLSCQEIENKRYTFTAIIRDITEKKRVEAERKRMLDELTYKNKEMEQIIYVTSHDLRSPLLNIQGFSRELVKDIEQVRQELNENNTSSAVKEKLAETLEEDIPDALKFILVSSSKMDTLLSGLLHLSRMGRVRLDIKRLDMNKLISNVIGAHEYKIKEAKVRCQIEELPSCSGDEVQIDQVFSNLLDNAMKYLDSDREGLINISGKKEDEHIVYCLEDNGIGIAEQHQDKVFEIFHRLNPGDSVAGEGLGLAIVRGILDRHGGKIWIESEPGKGSKFFVSLPG